MKVLWSFYHEVVIFIKPVPTPEPFHCSAFYQEQFLEQIHEWLTPHSVQVSVQVFSENIPLIIPAKVAPPAAPLIPKAALFLFIVLSPMS